MRNHGNALQAMLLRMHDTWNDLTANDEVKYALGLEDRDSERTACGGLQLECSEAAGIFDAAATAGARSSHVRRRCTFQIYKSFEGLVPMQNARAPLDQNRIDLLIRG